MAAVVMLPAPQTVGAQEPSAQEPEAQLRAAAESAWTVVGRHVAALQLAESRRRSAEARVVAAYRERDVTRTDLQARRRSLERERDRLADLREQQNVADERFDEAVLTAYKYGSTQAASLLLAALNSAAEAHEIGRIVKDLDAVLDHHHAEWWRLTQEVDDAEADVVAAEAGLDQAAAAVRGALGAIRLAEAEAAEARTYAYDVESRLLDAFATQLDAEAALQAAMRLDPVEEPDIDGTGTTSAPPMVLPPPTAVVDSLARAAVPVGGDAQPVDVDTRRRWLENRRGVLTASTALSEEAWYARSGLVCPVTDAVFTNDFHNARSQGRRHLGNDLFAISGTPVRAMFEATVTAVDRIDAFDGDRDLGGITVTYEAQGQRVYAAHLETVAQGVEIGTVVRAGQVIGYVGSSGNADGGAPHLHLGWYVGDVAINPYVSLAIACV